MLNKLKKWFTGQEDNYVSSVLDIPAERKVEVVKKAATKKAPAKKPAVKKPAPAKKKPAVKKTTKKK